MRQKCMGHLCACHFKVQGLESDPQGVQSPAEGLLHGPQGQFLRAGP